MNKAEAILTLDDEIFAIERLALKANHIVTTMFDKYFGKYSSKDDEGKSAIINDFERNAIMGDIATDYILELVQSLKALREGAHPNERQ